jgi:hypothetical protein
MAGYFPYSPRIVYINGHLLWRLNYIYAVLLYSISRILTGGLDSSVPGRPSGGNGIGLEGSYVRGHFIPIYSIQDSGYIGKITG